MKASQGHKSPPNATFTPKALSPAQEAAIELYLAGKGDTDVASTLGIARETAWHWRKEHAVFRAHLERRRAEVWGTASERLRALLAKAVENIATRVEDGDYEASVELLKITGLSRGVVNAVGEMDAEQLIKQQAEARVRREGIPEDANRELLVDLHTNPAYRRRLQEIEAELRAEYGEESSA
jgi:hypothetical protein